MFFLLRQTFGIRSLSRTPLPKYGSDCSSTFVFFPRCCLGTGTHHPCPEGQGSSLLSHTEHLPALPGRRASRRPRFSGPSPFLCWEGGTMQPLGAGGGLQHRRAALTVLSNRFPCFIFSCFCSAKRGGPEYLRYFPLPVFLGTKHSDHQIPGRGSSGVSGMNSPPSLHTTSTGSCLPSPPGRCC